MNETIHRLLAGTTHLPGGARDNETLDWNEHPAFAGVALKHLITGADTGGGFSLHLVRLAPGACIGLHRHDPQQELHQVLAGAGTCVTDGAELDYAPGVCALLPARQDHEVRAGAGGLLLAATFVPPLV